MSEPDAEETERLRLLNRIDDAIREYVQERGIDEAAILTEWVTLGVTYLPEHDGNVHGYWCIHPDGQAVHSNLGLMASAMQTLQSQDVAHWVGMHEEED